MIKYIDSIDVAHKNVLVRVDFNVPLDSNGAITDDTRIREALPTIRYLIEQEARLILCSHLGRPKGQRKPELSMAPVGERLADLINTEVTLVDEVVGEGVHQLARHSKEPQIMLLENLRYYPGETNNDREFSEQLASLADIYITDAFGTAHRKHASTFGVPELMSDVGAGFLVKKEIESFDRLLHAPENPFVLVVGGAKVTDKLAAIGNLLNIVDTIIVGGAMAYAFLAAEGKEIGQSKCEKEGIDAANSILNRAKAKKIEILLPMDHVVVDGDSDSEFTNSCVVSEIPRNGIALDIGPVTVNRFSDVLHRAKSIFWNGPQGFFEKEPFGKGTQAIGQSIYDNNGFCVAGGGDTISAIKKFDLSGGFDLISTGGGASLEYLEGQGLPGIDVLSKKRQHFRPEAKNFDLDDE